MLTVCIKSRKCLKTLNVLIVVVSENNDKYRQGPGHLAIAPCPLQSPEEKTKTKLKLCPNLYVLKCTVYIQYVGMFLSDFYNFFLFKDVPKIFQTLPGWPSPSSH
jgi:hypothetical protein